MKLWAFGSVLTLAIGAAASSGWADSVTLKSTYSGSFFGTTSSDGLTVYNNLGGTIVSPVTTVGAYGWTVQSGSSTALGPVGSSIYTYCIQLGQTFSGGSSDNTFALNFDVAPSPTGKAATDAGYIDTLAAAQLQALVTNHWAYSLTGKVQTAAFQLAVWEIEYDGGSIETPLKGSGENLSGSMDYYFGRTNGKILTATWSSNTSSVSYQAVNLATTWLNELTNVSVGNPAITTAVALNSPGTMDQTGGIQDQLGIKAVPVPAALPVGVAMLAGMAVVRKIRRRA